MERWKVILLAVVIAACFLIAAYVQNEDFDKSFKNVHTIEVERR